MGMQHPGNPNFKPPYPFKESHFRVEDPTHLNELKLTLERQSKTRYEAIKILLSAVLLLILLLGLTCYFHPLHLTLQK